MKHTTDIKPVGAAAEAAERHARFRAAMGDPFCGARYGHSCSCDLPPGHVGIHICGECRRAWS